MIDEQPRRVPGGDEVDAVAVGGRRVALVHDYLLVMRGAERTFAAIAQLFPHAPIFTLLHDPTATRGWLDGRSITTSPLQRLGVTQRGFRYLLPLLPWATEQLRFDGFELVVSSSSAFAHGVRVPRTSVHLSYCHSPFRYAWHERERALADAPRALRPALGRLLERTRRWDLAAAPRVDRYIANSRITAERLRRWYGRDARVVHPPVDVERFRAGDRVVPEPFFLFVGELVSHKRIELALEGARRAGMRLKVVGDGPERARLSTAYRGTGEFLGRVDDAELAALYARARALIVPNIEEFGIAGVEAQAAGRPVVAADGGGARETVIDGVTGVFFRSGDAEALAQALRTTDFDRFSPADASANAERFSSTAFRRALAGEISEALSSRSAGAIA